LTHAYAREAWPIPHSMLLLYIAILGAAFLVWFVLVVLFSPALNYHLRQRLPVHAPVFLHVVQSTCQSPLHRGNRVQILTNGEQYYPLMLEAIRAAQRSVNIECYMARSGRVMDEFIAALSERARAGVVVTMTVDAIGSSRLTKADRHRLREAGCRFERYQALSWYRLARLNNRTHRDLMIVDGRVAFLGGAGIGDQWHRAYAEEPAWRDTMARVEGPVVAAIQGVFVENWVECCGEIMTGSEFFPPLEPAGDTAAFVVKSSPSDRATVSRVVFQMLIEGATHDLRISTPYFLPDRTLRRAFAGAAQRGVRLTVLLPGPLTDQRWVRIASRRNYGELLAAGVRIFEYQPAMTHVKALLVDEAWSVIGTTNVDNRSFEHNDEVNLAMVDSAIVSRLKEDFERDLQASREITLAEWRARPWWETLMRPVVWILERQQ
jgi:cardiolipin synthase